MDSQRDWQTHRPANIQKNEALKSGMCDVIKIRIKWGDATRNKPNLKFGKPSFKFGHSTAVLLFSG